MFDFIIQNNYWYMFVQVMVTLLIFPIVSFKRFVQTANAYCDAYYPGAKKDIEKYKAASVKKVLTIASLCLLVGIVVVLHASFNVTELFNWDDQAGLMVLFVLAMVPVATITFVQKGLFNVFKKHSGSKRSASLRQQKWQDLYHKPSVLLLVAGQFVFIGTVSYFANHPFLGFAGYINLAGLLLINGIFAASSYAIYRNNKMGAIQVHEQRQLIKARAVRVNLIVWIIAIYNLSFSMWIAGLGLNELKLILQSVYFQLIIFLTAYTLSIPNPVASKNTSSP
jgi:hypothetical protein